jgi:DNA-binding LacI/PurR family transcriptional regulator
MLKWAAHDLAERSGVSLSTIKRMQAADGVPPVSAKSLELAQRAIEEAGVKFTNGDEPGVKMSRAKTTQ